MSKYRQQEESQRSRLIRWGGLFVIALTMLILVAVVPPKAKADTTSFMEPIVKTDVTFAVAEYNGGGGTNFDFDLQEWKDLNSDGDITDAGERTIHIQQTSVTGCTAASINPHFSCLQSFPYIWFIWRNASSLQETGRNYTININVNDGLGNNVASWGFGVKFKSAHNEHEQTRALINATLGSCATDSACELQHRGTRSLINQSYANTTQNISLILTNLTVNFPFTWELINATSPGDSLANFMQTWTWINQSYANVSQNMTAHHAVMVANHAAQDAEHASQDLTHPGGCNEACQGNISQNVTGNFTLFTSDCHGTGSELCVNGHLENQPVNELAKIVMALAVLALLLWLGTHEGTYWPLLGFVGSILAFGVALWGAEDLFLNEVSIVVFLGACLITAAIGAVNTALSGLAGDAGVRLGNRIRNAFGV